MKMTDWLATAIGLPNFFKNSDPGPGAGKLLKVENRLKCRAL
jgi:hypothetical protein